MFEWPVETPKQPIQHQRKKRKNIDNSKDDHSTILTSSPKKSALGMTVLPAYSPKLTPLLPQFNQKQVQQWMNPHSIEFSPVEPIYQSRVRLCLSRESASSKHIEHRLKLTYNSKDGMGSEVVGTLANRGALFRKRTPQTILPWRQLSRRLKTRAARTNDLLCTIFHIREASFIWINKHEVKQDPVPNRAHRVHNGGATVIIPSNSFSK